MVAAGELEAGHEGMENEEGAKEAGEDEESKKEESEEEDIDLEELLNENESNDILSKEEWERYYKEYNQNGLNWLLRQLDVLDGEEERTEYAWDYSVEEIESEFGIEKEAANIVHQIFAILKEPYGQPDFKTQLELTKKLFQWATPKELVNKNPEAWDSMAWADDYDQYLKSVDGGNLMENESNEMSLEELLAELSKVDEEYHDDKTEELEEAMATIAILKKDLNEINLLNAKLLYTNKIFRSKSLTESQKVKVLTAFDKATTKKEVELVYETLNEGLKVSTISTKSPIKESLGSASRALGSAISKPIIENDAFSRMRELAGLKK